MTRKKTGPKIGPKKVEIYMNQLIVWTWLLTYMAYITTSYIYIIRYIGFIKY